MSFTNLFDVKPAEIVIVDDDETKVHIRIHPDAMNISDVQSINFKYKRQQKVSDGTSYSTNPYIFSLFPKKCNSPVQISAFNTMTIVPDAQQLNAFKSWCLEKSYVHAEVRGNNKRGKVSKANIMKVKFNCTVKRRGEFIGIDPWAAYVELVHDDPPVPPAPAADGAGPHAEEPAAEAAAADPVVELADFIVADVDDVVNVSDSDEVVEIIDDDVIEIIDDDVVHFLGN